MNDLEMLTGLNADELDALAGCTLAPAAQDRLDELLARSNEPTFPVAERRELDRLLDRTDQLTILKTWARYTLHHSPVEAAAP